MDLAAGQFVSVAFDKHGVALVATLFGPDGRKLGVFGSNVSKQGPEKVTFVTGTSGTYRIDVRTFFKPPSPGRYEVKLSELRPVSEQDRINLAVQSCQEKHWLDRDNNFLVDLLLNSLSECMSAVGSRLEDRQPKASAVAADTNAEVAFLVSRWHWGEFVSTHYQENLVLDFRMLASAANETDKKKAFAIMRAVADDLKIKADHCRNSTRGLGRDVKVQVKTRKGNSEESGWQIYYKMYIFEFAKGHTPEHFPNPSSPTVHELPPAKYLIWAEKPGHPRSKEDLVTVGEGKQQLDWVLFVP
jgi:hypothetical protein